MSDLQNPPEGVIETIIELINTLFSGTKETVNWYARLKRDFVTNKLLVGYPYKRCLTDPQPYVELQVRPCTQKLIDSLLSMGPTTQEVFIQLSGTKISLTEVCDDNGVLSEKHYGIGLAFGDLYVPFGCRNYKLLDTIPTCDMFLLHVYLPRYVSFTEVQDSDMSFADYMNYTDMKPIDENSTDLFFHRVKECRGLTKTLQKRKDFYAYSDVVYGPKYLDTDICDEEYGVVFY